MAPIDLCFKNGKHIITILLDFEDGDIVGEDFSVKDIDYIWGYKDQPFRITITEGGDIKHYLATRVDFVVEDGVSTAKIEGRSGPITCPVTHVVEVVSHKGE